MTSPSQRVVKGKGTSRKWLELAIRIWWPVGVWFRKKQCSKVREGWTLGGRRGQGEHGVRGIKGRVGLEEQTRDQRRCTCQDHRVLFLALQPKGALCKERRQGKKRG